jgi:N-acetylglutamate synthase-like GNAT family acetyltransferase
VNTDFAALPCPDICADTTLQVSQITVREATPNDADSLNTLYRLLTANAAVNVRPDRIAAIAKHDDHFLLIAEIDNHVCGTVFTSFCMDAMFGEQPFTVIENIVIDMSWRRHGVGRKLLATVEAMSIARTSSKMMLLSAIEREFAHAFFQKIGFASDKKRGFVKYRSQFDA